MNYVILDEIQEVFSIINTSVAEYMIYGGMPLAVLKPEDEKANYLKELFKTTYFKGKFH